MGLWSVGLQHRVVLQAAADISEKHDAAILNFEVCRLTLDKRKAVTETQGWGIKVDSKPIIYALTVSTPVQSAREGILGTAHITRKVLS